MKYRVVHIILLCILQLNIFSQSDDAILNCGFSYLNSDENQHLEALYQRFLNSKSKSSRSDVVTIPIVVHIIHDNGPENISDAQVIQGIEWLNDAFRNRGVYYSSSSVDTKIEFCLAQQDTLGNAFSGIIRHPSPYTDMSLPGAIQAVADLTKYDDKYYLNVQLVRQTCLSQDDCNVAGFGGPGYGLIMNADFVGQFVNANKLMVHEMAHAMGLLHTFQGGCKNDNCLTDGDKVCDTPPDRSNYDDCILPINSCMTDEDDASSNNPFRAIGLGGLGDQDDDNANYVDYNFFRCQNNFSQGQVDRMHFYIDSYYKSLLTSKACLPPCDNVVSASMTWTPFVTEVIIGDSILIIGQAVNTDSFLFIMNHQVVSQNDSFYLKPDAIGTYTISFISIAKEENCTNDTSTVVLNAVCPVIADFNVIQNDNHIQFTNTSINEENIAWSIKDGANILFTSNQVTDNYTFQNGGAYYLCLTSSNAFCSDEKCSRIDIFHVGDEICDDGLDNDQDGFVDLFDDECPCDPSAYQAQCPVPCEYLPDSFPEIKMKLKWRSEIYADIFTTPFGCFIDDNNEIITKTSTGTVGNYIGQVVRIDARTGNIIKKINIDTSFVGTASQICINKNFFKNETNYFARDYMSNIHCFNNKGDLLWKQNSTTAIKGSMQEPKLADFNNDEIPELYAGNTLLNSTNGKMLFTSNNSAGCNFNNVSNLCNLYTNSIAGDFTTHSGLELACGNVVYEIDINNPNDTLGNTFKEISAPSPVKDGFTSMADIDGDGLLDIIVVRSNQNNDGGVWVWNPRNSIIIAQNDLESNKREAGGLAAIADLDNDCFPEIVVAFKYRLNVYSYDGTSSLKLKYSKQTTDESGATGVTMFDLNQDGTMEIIYRDETELRIFDGPTGKVIASYPVLSRTWTESPMVTDVDDDGHAEIIVSGGIEHKDSIRIFCFESATTPWAPARKVWNQTGYNVTNVNDDLTIPRDPQNPAAFFDTDSCSRETCNQPYNTFMCQATYRNQNGCVQWPAVDLSIEALSYECTGDSLIFYLAIDNESDKEMLHDSVYLVAYSRIPDLTSIPMYETTFHYDRDANGKLISTDTIRVAISMPSLDTRTILWRINDPGDNGAFSSIKGLTEILECDYENNSDVIDIDISLRALDLGPDISKCETEVITLNAGAGFASYEWSDLTTDSIYSTSFPGMHTVTVTDACGRSYSDTILFTIDDALTVDIGPDASICEAEDLTYGVDQYYQEVHWFPSANVDCDTCHNVSIIADSSFTLYMVANLNGCIVTDTAYIEILQIAQRDIDATICESDSILFYGNYYNKTGDYKEKIGVCDSVIVLHLSVMSIDSTLTHEEICQGDSLLFMGTWFDHEINATYTLTNADGCDSVLTLELRVRPSYDLRDTISICAGDSILLGNAVIKEMGDYPQYFTTTLMCDSILTTHVYVVPSVAISQNYEICEGDSALIFGSWVNTAGEYSEHYASHNGCDSTAMITLSVQKSYNIKDTLSICEGDSVWIGNNYIYTAGEYTQHLSTITSCDSTITTTVNISPYIRNTENMELCEGDTLILHDRIITEAGSYVDTLSNTVECTKIETTIVSILPTVISTDSLTLCPEESTVIHNVTIDHSGIYDLSYANATGCDSIVHLQVRALQWPPEAIIDMDCKNRTYSAVITPQWPWTPLWSNGSSSDVTTLSEGGTLGILLTTPQGCEKSYTYELPIIPDITAIPSFDDAIVDRGTSIPLKIDLDANEWSARWFPSELASCDTCLNTSILATKDTTMSITLIHISGCSFETSFRILVKDQINILIPNVFSPNSENENNTWTIHLPEGYLIQELSIYDRWGNKVHYSSGSDSATWDGKWNGQRAASGVYVYHLKYVDDSGRVVVKIGDVTVVY